MKETGSKFQVSGFKLEALTADASARVQAGNLKPRQPPETRNLKRNLAGFTLLELIVVICVAGVLAAAAVERLLYYQELAEKAAMESVLAGTKMGLQIRMAELIITGNQGRVVELETENPMRWLDEPPASYGGEYGASAKAGNWYFAPDQRQLVYVPNSSRHLQVGDDEPKELRFQVTLRYAEMDGGAGMMKTLSGVVMEPVRPYRWF